jgi:hypothetical protein
MHELNVLRARAFARAGDEERRPQDVMALVRQKQIRGAYAEAAVALARTGEADDQALSNEIAGFLAAMPPAVSRRLALAREMIQGRQATQPAREPEGGAGPERPPPERGRGR